MFLKEEKIFKFLNENVNDYVYNRGIKFQTDLNVPVFYKFGKNNGKTLKYSFFNFKVHKINYPL